MPRFPFYTCHPHANVLWAGVLRLMASSSGAERGESPPPSLPNGVPAAPSITALSVIFSSRSLYNDYCSSASALLFSLPLGCPIRRSSFSVSVLSAKKTWTASAMELDRVRYSPCCQAFVGQFWRASRTVSGLKGLRET